jgi:peptidoglycan/LPS O-acetylase OafA/YrhL
VLAIDVPSLRRDIVWALGWASNWGTITAGGDYWARFGEASPVAHFWSLAVEEQLYLVWPVVVWLLARRGGRTRAIGVAALALAAASVGTMLVLFEPNDPTATYLHTGARAHSLLLGAAAASVSIAAARRPHLRAAIRALFLPAVATVVAIGLLSDEGSTWLYRWGFPVFALAMALIVMRVGERTDRSRLAHPVLAWVGDRSYGIYLWHWPVILLLSPPRFGVTGPVRDVLCAATAVGLAAVSHAWLEQPIRRSRRVTWAWAPGIAGVALLVCVAVLGFASPSARPSGGSASAVTLPPATTVPPPTEPEEIAQVLGMQLERPVSTLRAAVTTSTTIAPTGPLRVLVVGDSTAMQLADALMPAAATDHPEHLVVGSAAFHGCGLTAAADGRKHESTNPDGSMELNDLSGCTYQWASLRQRVVDEAVDVVVVYVAAWDGTDIHLADGREVSIAQPAGKQLVSDAYRAFVADVSRAGARMLWVVPPDLEVQWDRLQTPLDDPVRWKAMRSLIHSLPVEELDLSGWLAGQGMEGQEGRPDGVHLTDALNERFVQEVVVPRLLGLRTARQAG